MVIPQLVYYLSLVLTAILTQFLILYLQCSADSGGYLLWAARKLAAFLIVTLLLQSAFGCAIYELLIVGLATPPILQNLAAAVVAGFLGVALPTGVIGLVATRILSGSDLERALSKTRNRLLLWPWVVRMYKEQIQRLKSLDNFRFQRQSHDWNFAYFTADQEDRQPGDAKRTEAARRLRLLSEFYKAEIANQRREPHLLSTDIDYFPGNRFFLLVAHLGRKGLRKAVTQSPITLPPSHDWNGSERRRVRGSVADRRNPGSYSSYQRISDDQLVRDLVARGEYIP